MCNVALVVLLGKSITNYPGKYLDRNFAYWLGQALLQRAATKQAITALAAN